MRDDEWRVEVDLADEGHGPELEERLKQLDLDDQVRERLGGRVIVTRDGPRVFLYTSTEAGAAEVERVVRELIAADEPAAEVTVTRWHPIEEAWKDASLPLPRTEAERLEEQRRLEEAETREAERGGSYDWHVKVSLPHRSDAVELEHRLREEGLPIHRRWRYLTIGAPTEESADELGARVRDDVPEANVWVEVNPEDLPNPLFVLLRRP